MKSKKIIILGAVQRKPNHFYTVDQQGHIREYRDFSWCKFTFKEIFQCFWIDVMRALKEKEKVGKKKKKQ